MDKLTKFLRAKYLKEYIKEGGSKIKFVTGRKSSGKTYFMKNLCDIADDLDYQTVYFSAKDVWLHDFREIYLAIYHQCDLMNILQGCAERIIVKMGYQVSDIPEGKTFMDYLADEGMGDGLTRREIRLQLKEMFLDNPVLDNNFALSCSLLTGGILGHPILEEQNKQLLLSYLEGDKTLKLALLKTLGLSPSRLTKYNARIMLRSLAEVIHLSGRSGLIVAIDDMEILIEKSSLASIHYTKMRREDTYESLRQLIDDIDSLQYVMFMLGFRRDLLDDDNMGIKSYQALWMRIQNEIVSQRFNCFADIIDMDRMAADVYETSDILELAQDIINKKQKYSAASISEEDAEEIMKRAKLGNIGVPGLVEERLFGGEEHD